MLKIGIDAGSTTLKILVVDESQQIKYRSYKRHYARIKELLIEELEGISDLLQGEAIQVAITGSAGYGLTQKTGIDFVQEVFAVSYFVQSAYEDVDSVIELGGEDAKIIFLKNGLEQRMNATCAGGTGAFIDQMASLMDLSVEELDQLSMQATATYPIASRCGVFAKSDIQPLLNQGAKKEDVSKSIFDAVVEQTITGLAQGREIQGKVLFLGGPLYFYKGLRKSFIDRFGEEVEAIFPQDGQYFVVEGCVKYLNDQPVDAISYSELIDKLRDTKKDIASNVWLPPLFENDLEYAAFKKRHESYTFKEMPIENYSGAAYLGIDAGSTTTKIILISEDDKILYQYYDSNKGNPVDIVHKELKNIYQLCGERIWIRSSAVTGYGEELIKAAFGVDHGIVETVAHFSAARYFEPNVSFILDIGGQDIKCFKVKDNHIQEILLNEACSSGCGSFIQTFAHQMGYDVKGFAQLALEAKHPVDLGTRCTVFMNSSIKQAQKEGATLADLSAGLAISVIKNTLYKVMRIHDKKELGEHIVVQGGTFYNDAVLRSLEKELAQEVIRPKVAGMMGALGAALYARRHAKENTMLLSSHETQKFHYTSTNTRCKRCTNNCALIVNRFEGDRIYISGNRCEKAHGQFTKQPLPNLYQLKYNKIRSFENLQGKRGVVGIPLVLNMYENIPFWATFFNALAFGVMLSDPSSKAIYVKGQSSIASDTACYPAKLAHGHIENLIEKGAKTIFYPCMSYNVDEGISDNCYNCPVVAYYPEIIKGNLKRISMVQYLMPYLDMNNKRHLVSTLYELLKETPYKISKKEVKQAIEKADLAYKEYKEWVKEQGVLAIDYAKASNKNIIVLAGRPYHIDPEINHGIDQVITHLEAVIVSEDSLACLEQEQALHVLNQWTYQARLYNAAQVVAKEDSMQLVQLVSFGCGTDAVTADELKRLLTMSNKLYTQIKIDENSNLGAAKIRLRSMFAATSSFEGGEVHNEKNSGDTEIYKEDEKRVYTLDA